MSEEQVKTKDEINNLETSKEINISFQSEQNKIDNSVKIDTNSSYRD